MNATTVDWLTYAATLGCGAVGGAFFTFSTFTMQGLTRLPATLGMAAMQSINVTAVRPAFMTLLFGTGAACAALAVHGVTAWQEDGSMLRVAGAALYLMGTIGVTVVRNVPLNNALAAVGPGDGAAVWEGYARRWTRWNHVRTLSSLAGAATLLAAVVGPG